MEINRLAALRPRFVWDIVDDAFDLYRERFALFCGISACVQLPVDVLTIIYTATSLNSMRGTSRNDPFEALGFLGPLLLVNLPLKMAASVLQDGATSVAVEAHLTGQPISIGQAYRRVLPRIWPLIGGMVLTGFFVLLGSCAMGIGAIVAAVALAFVGQAIVLERRGAWDAVRRSTQLAFSNFAKVLGLVVLVYLLSSILTSGLQGIVELLFTLLPSRGGSSAQTLQRTVLSQSLTSVATLIIEPLGTLAATLLYYDLRVRREGLDISTAAQEAGVALAPDPFGDLSSDAAYRKMYRAPGANR